MKVDDRYQYEGTVLRVLYLGLTCDAGPLVVVFVEKADKKHEWPKRTSVDVGGRQILEGPEWKKI
jgi:hypothetical protein